MKVVDQTVTCRPQRAIDGLKEHIAGTATGLRQHCIRKIKIPFLRFRDLCNRRQVSSQARMRRWLEMPSVWDGCMAGDARITWHGGWHVCTYDRTGGASIQHADCELTGRRQITVCICWWNVGGFLVDTWCELCRSRDWNPQISIHPSRSHWLIYYQLVHDHPAPDSCSTVQTPCTPCVHGDHAAALPRAVLCSILT